MTRLIHGEFNPREAPPSQSSSPQIHPWSRAGSGIGARLAVRRLVEGWAPKQSRVSMGLLHHAPSRRAFLLLWGGWTFAGFLLAVLQSHFGEVGLVVGAVLLVVTWIALAGMELNFRHRMLPREAQRPWHALLVFFVLTIPILAAVAGPKYDFYLPRSRAGQEECQLLIKRQNASEQDLEFIFDFEWEKTNWGRTVRTKSFSETRIWTPEAKETGWIIDPHLKEARPMQSSVESLNLTADGFERLITTLAKDPLPNEQVKRSAAILRDVLSKRASRAGATLGPQFMLDRSLSTMNVHVPWIWISASLFSLCLFPVTWMVVGTTMFPRAASARE